MKKASKILLTIGGVLHIVNGVAFVGGAIAFIVGSIMFFGLGNNWFVNFFENESADAEYIGRLTFTISAIIYIFASLLFAALAALSFVGSKLTFGIIDKGEKKQFIIGIVFGALLDNAPALVGSIFKLFVEKEPNDLDSQAASEVVK